MDTKYCKYCQLDLAIDRFHLKKRKKDGSYLRSDRCKACTKLYTAEYNRVNRKLINSKARDSRNKRGLENRLMIYKYLSDHPCVDCGEIDIRLLQFDHRDRSTKQFCISAAYNKLWEHIKAEIDKCDIRCVSCHTLKTGLELNWWKHLPIELFTVAESDHHKAWIAKKQLVLELLIQGYTKKEVAISADVSLSTISRWCLYDPSVAPFLVDITIKPYNQCRNGHMYTEEDWNSKTNKFNCMICRKLTYERNYTPTTPREYCQQGLHEWVPDNIILSPRGDGTMKELCRPCKNIRNRKYYRKTNNVSPEQFRK